MNGYELEDLLNSLNSLIYIILVAAIEQEKEYGIGSHISVTASIVLDKLNEFEVKKAS
jgi:hypothetical protein